MSEFTRIVTIDPRWRLPYAGRRVTLWLPDEMSDWGVNAVSLPEPGNEPKRHKRAWTVSHAGTMRQVRRADWKRPLTFAEAMDLARVLDQAVLGMSQVRERPDWNGTVEEAPLGWDEATKARAILLIDEWYAQLTGRLL